MTDVLARIPNSSGTDTRIRNGAPERLGTRLTRDRSDVPLYATRRISIPSCQRSTTRGHSRTTRGFFVSPKRKNPGSAFGRHQPGFSWILGRCLLVQVTSLKCHAEVISYPYLSRRTLEGDRVRSGRWQWSFRPVSESPDGQNHTRARAPG